MNKQTDAQKGAVCIVNSSDPTKIYLQKSGSFYRCSFIIVTVATTAADASQLVSLDNILFVVAAQFVCRKFHKSTAVN